MTKSLFDIDIDSILELINARDPVIPDCSLFVDIPKMFVPPVNIDDRLFLLPDFDDMIETPGLNTFIRDENRGNEQ